MITVPVGADALEAIIRAGQETVKALVAQGDWLSERASADDASELECALIVKVAEAATALIHAINSLTMGLPGHMPDSTAVPIERDRILSFGSLVGDMLKILRLQAERMERLRECDLVQAADDAFVKALLFGSTSLRTAADGLQADMIVHDSAFGKNR